MPETKAKPAFVLIEPGRTPITAPELVAKLREGVTLRDLAAWLGYSESHVRAFLKSAGYTSKPQPPMWQGEPAEAVSEPESAPDGVDGLGHRVGG